MVSTRALAARLAADKWAFDGSDFRRLARLRAALWREERGWPMGVNVDGTPLGSRLRLPDAMHEGWNFLTPTALATARAYAHGGESEPGAVLKVDRLFADLLSSQPLMFNLAAGLAADLDQATEFARRRWPDVDRVTAVRFEHSPGRGDPRYLANGTAFDLVFFHTVPGGGRGFVAVEGKYHEDLRDPLPAVERPRYRAVARESGAFLDPESPALWTRGTWQLWLDHLLACALWRTDGYERARSVLLYPAAHAAPRDAADRYRSLLRTDAPVPFEAETLDSWVDDLPDRPLAAALHERYLDFGAVERAVG